MVILGDFRKKEIVLFSENHPKIMLYVDFLSDFFAPKHAIGSLHEARGSVHTFLSYSYGKGW